MGMRRRRVAELDAELTGSNPIDVLITFPPGADLYAPQTLATIADVHRTLETEPGVGNVWSLETLRRWLAEKMGLTSIAALKQYVSYLPRYLVQRFIAQDQKAVIVSGLVPDKNLPTLVPIVDRAAGAAQRSPRGASRLFDLGDGPFRHRGPQQRRHDQRPQSRADGRIRLHSRLHRARVPLSGRSARRACCRAFFQWSRRARC